LKVAVTGATGFVGSYLLRALSRCELVAIGRRKPDELNKSQFFNALIASTADYSCALADVDVVVHCAARAHIMKDEAVNPLEEYRAVNTAGTINLATQAASLGVKRFIFISSIKVNGEQTQPCKPFTSVVGVAPTDPYGLSKYEAELQLAGLAKKTGMEVVIIRPPLIYGEGVTANFASMLKLSAIGLPLPFGDVTRNRRSFVSVDNLVDLIVTCMDHPNAANETFLVSDNEDLSTAETFTRLSLACGKSGRLIPIPAIWFERGFKLMGKTAIYQRLFGSLQVDISDTIKKLSWYPPYRVSECFARTAKYYTDNK